MVTTQLPSKTKYFAQFQKKMALFKIFSFFQIKTFSEVDRVQCHEHSPVKLTEFQEHFELYLPKPTRSGLTLAKILC